MDISRAEDETPRHDIVSPKRDALSPDIETSHEDISISSTIPGAYAISFLYTLVSFFYSALGFGWTLSVKEHLRRRFDFLSYTVSCMMDHISCSFYNTVPG